MPKIATTAPTPAVESAAPGTSTTEAPSKKRARDDNDDGAGDQGVAKKVDMKEKES